MSRVNHMVVSQGELSVIRTCGWKHHLKYTLQLEPAESAYQQPLEVGDMVHGGVAEAYREVQRQQLSLGSTRGLDKQAVLDAVSRYIDERVRRIREASGFSMFSDADSDSAAESTEQEAKAAVGLFIDHVLWRDIERYVVVAIELPFRVPLMDKHGRRVGDQLEGVIDLVLYDIHVGKLVLGEHKTTRSDAFTYDFRIEVDPQIPLYLFAMSRMFDERDVSGAIHLNVVRKTAPKRPAVNKDGTVSTAAVDTTRDMYQAALLEQTTEPTYLAAARQNHAEKQTKASAERLETNEAKWRETQQRQADVLASLGGIDKFASRHSATIPQHLVRRYTVDAWSGARMLRHIARGDFDPMRNGHSCNSRAAGKCSYRDACVDDVVAPGELLKKRAHRHGEVVDANEEFLATGGELRMHAAIQLGRQLHTTEVEVYADAKDDSDPWGWNS